MKRGIVLVQLFIVVGVAAKEINVSGTVTYQVGQTVYTSLGSQAGLRDSALVYAILGPDTVAVMKVIAVSSKSSACQVLSAKREIRVGGTVVSSVSVEEQQNETAVNSKITDSRQLASSKKSSRYIVDVRGRVSAQFYTSNYEQSAYNFKQPGIVAKLRAEANRLPVAFEMYGNFRTLSYGGASPFSGHSRNRSRLYQFSLEYNDGLNAASIGRIVPAVGPSVGYIDGALLSRRMGNFLIATTFGFQPSFSLRGVDTDFKKFAVFCTYEQKGTVNGAITGGYARTYFQSQLDREVASIRANMLALKRLFIYANGEFDLRTKSGNSFVLSPQLTMLFMNLNYRLTRALSVGLGGNASRSVSTYSSIRSVPDSLLDRRLRGGLSVNVKVSLPGGISLYNAYTPRSSGSTFAEDYSNYASVMFSNIFASGLSVRSNGTVNENEYTRSVGYGLNLQQHLPDLLDVTFRYQQYAYTVKEVEGHNRSTTFGVDVIVPVTNQLMMMASYDRVEGYGTESNSLFTELSVRF